MSGFSLWLCPPDSSNLRALVARLAHKQKTEVFAPHCTLVSDEIVPALPVEELVKAVEAGIQEWLKQGAGELNVRLKDVRQGPLYYQCVLAALFPDKPLVSLHEAVVRQFPLASPPPPYFPHVSLVYGDLSTSLKASIIDDLNAAGEVKELEGEEGVEVVGEKDFKPGEVLLMKTAGPCATWELLARVPIPTSAA
ncbi:hypothetical protein JCM6882_003146 [Rhodosporidiobolus microsporus]